MVSQRLTPHLLIPVLLLALAGPAHAKTRHTWRPGWLPGDPVTPASPAPVWARPVKVVNTNGLYMAIDPVTHRPIAPTPEQLRAFREAHPSEVLEAPTRPLRVEKLPKGGEIIFLNGAFRSYSVARRAPNGHFTVTETNKAPAPEVK